LFGQAHATTITVTSTGNAGGTCPGPTCTLRQAIASADFFSGGDTINFALPANSVITLTSGELLINKNLTISGPGAKLLTVMRSSAFDAGDFRIFNIGQFNVTISGLTITNGKNVNGGGIQNNGGNLTIANCAISDNHTGDHYAGGIHHDFGTLTIINSTISNNSTSGHSDSGGILIAAGTATITNSTVSGNMTDGEGGGINNLATLTLINSTISDNSASEGGGIYGDGVTAKNTIIAKNSAPSGPDISGTFTSQGYNFIGIEPTPGITPMTGDQIGTADVPKDPKLDTLKDNGGPTETHALLSDSTAIERGNSFGSNTDQRGFARPVVSPLTQNPVGDGSDIGAYEVQADLLPGCNTINRIVKNKNDSGMDSLRGVIGSVCAGSTITFAPNVRGAIDLTSDQLLVNKFLTIDGPGANLLSVQRSASAGNLRIFKIFPASVIASISGLTIANGSAPPDGTSSGGITSNGTLTLSNCTVSGNTNNQTSGGGILNSSGTLTIINSTISGNSTTAGFAGGIYNYAGTLTITNSTISGNSATESFNGVGLAGGILNTNGGTVILTNSTIAGNTGQYRAGGIRNTSGSTVRSKNTIIALNTSPTGPDVDGELTSEGFNLIGSTSGAMISPQTSDQKDVGAAFVKLGSLQDNGGPTQTQALLSGSVAIDKGNSSGSFFDQRGFIRPVGSANVSGGDGGDIGAFEFGGKPMRITSITRLANGHVALQGIGVPNGTHTIHASPDLSPNSFAPLPGTATANGTGVLQYDDAGAVGLTKRFYRVSFP
jgi:hypothetical protein